MIGLHVSNLLARPHPSLPPSARRWTQTTILAKYKLAIITTDTGKFTPVESAPTAALHLSVLQCLVHYLLLLSCRRLRLSMLDFGSEEQFDFSRWRLLFLLWVFILLAGYDDFGGWSELIDSLEWGGEGVRGMRWPGFLWLSSGGVGKSEGWARLWYISVHEVSNVRLYLNRTNARP